jgi:hypothetical protein
LENPEYPDAMRPADLSGDLLNKYSVGHVIVHPRIVYTDGAMTTQNLFVVFFSQTNTSEVAVKALTVFVNGKKLEYGEQIIDDPVPSWELYPINGPFYAGSISGEPIACPKVEMTKARVDVSLIVLVKDESGKVTEKKIDAYFVPKKRSYLE